MKKEKPLLLNFIFELLKLFKVSSWRSSRFLRKIDGKN